MKWLGVVLLLAAGCTFPSFLIRGDEGPGGSSGSGGGGATSTGGTAMAGSASGGASAGTTSGGSAGTTSGGSGGSAGSAGATGGGGSGAAAGTASELGPVGVPGNWELTLEEEFEDTTLDDSLWITYMREGGNAFREWGGRQEFIADESVTLDNGECVITAANQATGNQPFTSGALNSADLFEQEYGYFEARIRIPLGAGFWSVWGLRSSQGWPPFIGGVEVLGGQPARALFSYWFSGESGPERVAYESTNDYTNGYHIYGIDWQPTRISFYVDGALKKSLDDLDSKVTGPLYPSVNLSISDAASGDPVPDDTTPWPGELRIDWIRVYERVP